jgi:hypothetical protein
MEKEFVPYELALRMKQLGFDEECFYVKLLKKKTKCFYTPSDYDDFPEQKEVEVGMPLFQQAFRWFREKHRLKHIWIMDELLDTGEYTYEEAELACLKYCIEIVESK